MLYNFRAYDKQLCLKINIVTWVIIIYLLRPFILMFSTLRLGRGSGPLKGVSGLKNVIYPDNFSLALGILAAVPVLVFLFAWIKRKPAASEFVRTVWRKGGIYISVSAVLNILIVLIPLLIGIDAEIHLAGWIQILLSILIVVYLFKSQRVRDTFDDFPVESKE